MYGPSAKLMRGRGRCDGIREHAPLISRQWRAAQHTPPLRNARIGRLQFRAPRASHKSERELLHAGWDLWQFLTVFCCGRKNIKSRIYRRAEIHPGERAAS